MSATADNQLWGKAEGAKGGKVSITLAVTTTRTIRERM